MSEEQPSKIDPETLRRWLAEGRDVQVLDIRTAEDRAEWSIPGSLHVDAYHALKAGDPNALANVPLRPDVPVVTVCGLGKTACIAADQLSARGLNALPLDGGMKGWSGAWNASEVLRNPDVTVLQLRRTGKGCLSYLIGSGGEAVVLDASLDLEVYVEIAAKHGWRISRVLETHVHADHLSRSRRLAETVGAEILLPEQERATFPYTAVRDGDLISVGRVVLKALRTPGHTLESTSYFLEGKWASKGARNCAFSDSPVDTQLLEGQLVFTGDTLFLSSVGRPDLGADAKGAAERASMLYHSVKRLFTLHPSTIVLPGHHSQPIAFDGQPIAAPLSDVVKKTSIACQSEETFIKQVLARIPPTPPNYLRIVELNEAGVFPSGDPRDLEAGANRCAI